ncbi:MATH domain and coiled-coil domain-containing protein At3g58370-like [Papaver somniferum]|uniref:MATH domain and coiled-coil domain-containing protein At3g58370-like n=1 Tax=Papaver somniferum TaxID=3469 RepID=UPI000E6FA629|nr:MATH domain and coiled-coil domain-containing protein At3g58370-like [Papaver somniferum]
MEYRSTLRVLQDIAIKWDQSLLAVFRSALVVSSVKLHFSPVPIEVLLLGDFNGSLKWAYAVKNNFPSSSKFKWVIEKVSELNQEDHFSPTFTVGRRKWRLLAFRRGSNADDYLSVYVVAVDCTNSRYAKFSLALVGQTNNTLKKDTEGQILQFTKEENDWGFDEFIRFNELSDPINGYIVNDACIIEVELCSFPKQDSIEESVPMELMESGHSGTKSPHEKTKKRKELEEDNSSSVLRKRPSIDRTKKKEGEQVIESGEEATQHGKQVIEKWQGAVQSYSKRKRAAAEGINAAGSGKVLDGKRVAENGKENKNNIVDGCPSSEKSNFENQPAKKAKMTLKKKASKANEGETRVVILISP